MFLVVTERSALGNFISFLIQGKAKNTQYNIEKGANNQVIPPSEDACYPDPIYNLAEGLYWRQLLYHTDDCNRMRFFRYNPKIKINEINIIYTITTCAIPFL